MSEEELLWARYPFKKPKLHRTIFSQQEEMTHIMRLFKQKTLKRRFRIIL